MTLNPLKTTRSSSGTTEIAVQPRFARAAPFPTSLRCLRPSGPAEPCSRMFSGDGEEQALLIPSPLVGEFGDLLDLRSGLNADFMLDAVEEERAVNDVVQRRDESSSTL